MTTAHTDGGDQAVLLSRGPFEWGYDNGAWTINGCYDAESGELRKVIFVSRTNNNIRKTIQILPQEFQFVLNSKLHKLLPLFYDQN